MRSAAGRGTRRNCRSVARKALGFGAKRQRGGRRGVVVSQRVVSRVLSGPGRLLWARTAFPLAAATAAAASPRVSPSATTTTATPGPPRAAGSMAAPAGGLEDAELREAQRDYLDFLDDEVRAGAGLRWEMPVLHRPLRVPGGWGSPLVPVVPCPPLPPVLGRWG